MKELILKAMYLQLLATTKAGIAAGTLKPPLNADNVIEATLRGLNENPVTASTIQSLNITRKDVARVVNRVYKELKCA